MPDDAPATCHSVTAAYDAALDAYFIAARAAEGGQNTERAGDGNASASETELVAAARAAADRTRAAVEDDRVAWTVCGGSPARRDGTG